MVGRETVTKHWATAIFLVVLAIAAFTAHAGALTISSSDTVKVSTKDSKDATIWEKMQAGDVASVELVKPTTIKLTVTGAMENDKVEPVVQVWPSTSKVVVKPNYAGSEVDVVLVGTDRIEGYYSYGKSPKYPWGLYFCIYTGEKPFVIYSEFSGRATWYNYIPQKTVDAIKFDLNNGKIPDVSIIQAAVGV